MRIKISDVQFEHYTPDPARGAARTGKRFKAGEKLEIWTDEKTIFITSGARTIAVPYGRAVWLEYDGPTPSETNPRRGKRKSSKAKQPGLPEASVSGAAEAPGRREPDESGGLLAASGQELRA